MGTNIGENIRRIRKLRGLTMQELGDLIGVSNPMIAKWERTTDCSTMRFSTLQKIAIALDTDIANLLGTEMGETMPLEKSHITLVNNEKKCKQLKKLCKPLVKYINEECDQYTEIRVTCDGAFLTSTILGVPNINEEKG